MTESARMTLRFIPRNKYLLTMVSFVIWVAFIDQSSLITQYGYKNQIKQLKKDKAFYLTKIRKDSVNLHELKTNNDNLEKFAREQYLMKRSNEDVFYVVDEEGRGIED